MNALRNVTRIRETMLAKPTRNNSTAVVGTQSCFEASIPHGERFYGHKHSSKKVVSCTGLFPAETYLNGRGFVIDPPKKEDKSAFVGFLNPPKGYTELKDEAARFGYRTLYRNPKLKNSVFTVRFSENPAAFAMENYTEEQKKIFFEKYPEGLIYDVQINPAVTNHLITNQKIELKSLLFDDISTSIYGDEPFGKMILFVKTPGGFWDLSWHSTSASLHNLDRLTGFTEVIRQFQVIPKEEEKVEPLEPVAPTVDTKITE